MTVIVKNPVRQLAKDFETLTFPDNGGRPVPLRVVATLKMVEVAPVRWRLQGLPMIPFDAGFDASTSLDEARKTVEQMAEERRTALGLSKQYRLTWLHGR